MVTRDLPKASRRSSREATTQTRESSIAKCGDCAARRKFLENRIDVKWAFKAAEARRRHVEEEEKATGG